MSSLFWNDLKECPTVFLTHGVNLQIREVSWDIMATDRVFGICSLVPLTSITFAISGKPSPYNLQVSSMRYPEALTVFLQTTSRRLGKCPQRHGLGTRESSIFLKSEHSTPWANVVQTI